MFHAIPRSRGRFKRPAQLLEGLKAPKTAGWWEGEHGHGWKRMTKGRREFKMFVLGGFFRYNLSVDVFFVQKSMVVTDLKGVEISSTLVTYVFHPTWPGIPRGHRIHVWYCLPTWNPWNQLKVRVNVGKMYHFPFTLWYMVCDRFWRHCFMVVSARWYSNLLCFSDFQVAQSRSVLVRMPSNCWLIRWPMNTETHY